MNKCRVYARIYGHSSRARRLTIVTVTLNSPSASAIIFSPTRMARATWTPVKTSGRPWRGGGPTCASSLVIVDRSRPTCSAIRHGMKPRSCMSHAGFLIPPHARGRRQWRYFQERHTHTHTLAHPHDYWSQISKTKRATRRDDKTESDS